MLQTMGLQRVGHNLGKGQHGLSGCGIRALEHLLSGSDTSLVAAEHVGS